MSAEEKESSAGPPMPLSLARAGSRVRLVCVRAGRGLARRLADMGFVPGDEIQVVSNGVPGPLVVLVKGSRLVLGRGMAEKILVK
ncbi:MAG: FeoA family protein [bacterium]|nr:FeoA family protein [bacterium]